MTLGQSRPGSNGNEEILSRSPEVKPHHLYAGHGSRRVTWDQL